MSTALYDFLPIPAFGLAANGSVANTNAAALNLLGFRAPAELLHKNFLDTLVSDEDKAETRVRINEALEGAGAEGRSTKVTLVTRAGRKQVVLRMATTRSPEGRISGAVVTAQEMNELHSVVGTRAAVGTGGAEHLSGALEASGVGLFCVDNEGRVLEWTQKVERITGLSKGQAQGKEFTAACLTEDFRQPVKKSLHQARRGLNVARFNVEIMDGNNKKEAWLSLAPWRSASGSIVGAVGYLEEAAEVDRRVQEAEWIRSTLSEVIDRANAPIFAIDSAGNLTEWNFVAHELTGKDKEDVVGKKLLDMVSGASVPALKDAQEAALGGFLAKPVQVTLEPGISMMVGLSPQFSYTNKIIGALCVAQIVPDGGFASAPAAIVGDSKGDGSFAPGVPAKTKAMVAHEMRSPLHGIIGLTNTLSQDKSPLQKPLQMMGASAERVLELITNLMDFWNLASEEAFTDDSHTTLVDLATLCNEVVQRCENAKDKRGKPLKKDKVELQKDLTSATVMGDSQSISHALQHLILNAYKFTASGHVKITVKPVEHEKVAQIIIEDTGIGMVQGKTDDMFNAFVQEDDSESRKYEGIGLGLAIVKEVLRVHGGKWNVKTDKDKGSMFIITFPTSHEGMGGAKKIEAVVPKALPGTTPLDMSTPRKKVPAPGSEPRGPPSSWLGPGALVGAQIRAQKGPVAAMPLGGHCITRTSTTLPSVRECLPLIMPTDNDGEKVIMSVDDDFVNQEVMRSVLEPCGFKIVDCMSGSECLAYLDDPAQGMPQLILLDLMMPGLSGFDVLQATRKKYSPEQLPIIMVSAKNQASSVVKGLELGCSDWIHKPFDRQELIARIKAHLRVRETFQQIQLLGIGGQSLQGSRNETQEVLQATALDAPEATPKSTMQEVPEGDETLFEGDVETTALFASAVTSIESDASLTELFEAFETLSSKYSAVRTEILGTCYIAVAIGKGDDTRHADRMLQLAVKMQDAARQLSADSSPHAKVHLKLGIFTDCNEPPVIVGMGGQRKRQYPRTCFFSSTVRKAKGLSDKAAAGCVLLSRGARCRLSADMEDELQHEGLRMVENMKIFAGEVYHLAKLGEVDTEAKSLEPNFEDCKVQQQDGPEAQALLVQREALQAQLLATEGELRKVQMALHSSQTQLNATQDKATTAESQARTLQIQLQQANETVRKAMASAQSQVKPPEGTQFPTQSLPQPTPAPMAPMFDASAIPAGASASLLFLQWQNAHLQAEARHYQQALSTARAELQMQLVVGQLLESKHSILQARVEHLELDLGFRNACGVPLLTAGGAATGFEGLAGVEDGLGFYGGEFAMSFGAGGVPDLGSTAPAAGLGNSFGGLAGASLGLGSLNGLGGGLPNLGGMGGLGGLSGLGGLGGLSGLTSSATPNFLGGFGGTQPQAFGGVAGFSGTLPGMGAGLK